MSWYYPCGAEFDSSALWNQTDMTEEEYEQYQDEKDYFKELFYNKDDI
jgi:hypothetical protein